MHVKRYLSNDGKREIWGKRLHWKLSHQLSMLYVSPTALLQITLEDRC